MNDFEAWEKILKQWETVERLKKLNQTLYDYLGSSLIYIMEYAKRNDIDLPHKDRLYKMVDESERIIDEISDYCKTRKSIPDEILHDHNNDPNRRQLDGTLCSDFWSFIQYCLKKDPF